MSNKVLTIYKIGREEAGMTQGQASELLDISTRQLSRYENLDIIPDDLIVSKMVKHYNAKWLGYMHLKEYTNVGRMILPDVIFQDVGLGTLRFLKEHTDIYEIKDEMIDIACDGIIDKQELPIWKKRHEKEIEELAGASLALLLRKDKSPLAGTKGL